MIGPGSRHPGGGNRATRYVRYVGGVKDEQKKRIPFKKSGSEGLVARKNGMKASEFEPVGPLIFQSTLCVFLERLKKQKKTKMGPNLRPHMSGASKN